MAVVFPLCANTNNKKHQQLPARWRSSGRTTAVVPGLDLVLPLSVGPAGVAVVVPL